jgi:PAS domain S-box-containing protein
MPPIEQFHQWADLFREAMLLVDMNGVILVMNQAARRHLGQTGIRSRQTSLLDICLDPPEQIQSYLHSCKRTKTFVPGTLTFSAIKGAPVAFRAEGALYAVQEHPSTSQLLLRLNPKQLAESRFVALNQQIEKLSREVDRRRRAELDLVDQRERFRVTLASIGDAVIATDIEGAVTFLNPVAEAHTGWESVAAIGKPLETIFQIVNESTRQTVENPVKKVISEGVVVGLANHTVLIRKDGSELHIDDSGAPIRDADGVIMGAVLVFHDITERRHLEHQIEARTQELEDEHRRKDEFLAMLGHELRNPLAPIKAALQLQALPNCSEEARKHAQEILGRQVDHLTCLVDELLDVARISTGKISLNIEVLEVASIVYRAIELCEPLTQEKKQIFSSQLPDEPLYVRGDLQRLTQVIGNVLNNATKYTQSGGEIHLTVQKVNESVEIHVKDNGMGIHQAILPRIFDVFSQSERALSRSEGGLGVGLTVVRRLVEQHGGNVTAFSEGPEKGSEFRISLPLVAADQPKQISPETLPTPSAAAGRKILVVDDNLDAAAMLSGLLQTLGNEVFTASNGNEAISVAAEVQPNVVFLDIGLPGMDGYAVAHELRSDPDMAGVTLIAVTGYGQQDDLRKTSEAGFDYHLIKPANFGKITDILASLPIV